MLEKSDIYYTAAINALKSALIQTILSKLTYHYNKKIVREQTEEVLLNHENLVVIAQTIDSASATTIDPSVAETIIKNLTASIQVINQLKELYYLRCTAIFNNKKYQGFQVYYDETEVYFFGYLQEK